MKHILTFSFIISSILIIPAQETTPRTLWKFQTDATIRSAPLISGDKIFFSNSAGEVYCLNKLTGSLIWRFNTDGAIAAAPSIANSTLFVVNRNNHVFALDAENGSQIWKYEMGETLKAKIGGWKYFAAAPVYQDGKIFVGSGDGALYTLNAEDGSLLWKYQTGRRMRAAGFVYGQTIYQPSNDGHIHALNTKNGKLKWKFATDGSQNTDSPYAPIITGLYDSPTKVGDKLLFGSRDGNMYAINTETQEKIWQHSYGPTWAMASTVDGNSVYVGWSTNNTTCSIDLDTGKENWKFQSGGHVYTKPLIIDENVVIGSADGSLYKLNKNTGQKVWSYEIGREIFSSPVHSSGTIYFGSDGGALYALKEGPKARLAYYLPDSIEDNSRYLVVDPELGPLLDQKGFQKLGKETLGPFLQDRVQDRIPSVVIFALPLVPDEVIGEDPTKGLMRQYLESGGKIVWMGDIPNFYELDENGQFKRDPFRGTQLLDVEFENPFESGNYYSKATQEGRNMGLPSWFKATQAIVKEGEGIVPLAYDEFGRVSVWMKKFSDKPNSGFVSCRTWAWNVHSKPEDMEVIYKLAAYGLE